MKITKWNGRPISKPGIYSGIPLPVYHSADICDGPSVSSSGLRTAWSLSMAHFFDQWPGNPNREEPESSPAMDLGSATHHLILGQDKFNLEYIGRPETYRDRKTAEDKPWNGNANQCKEWLAKQAAAGRTVLKQDDLRRIIKMARSLQLEPLVIAEALRGDIECSMMVKDAETGLWIKCRPDVMPTDGDYVDLKTAREVTDVAIRRVMREAGYHMQGGLIWEACEQLGLPFETFTLFFVESNRPFCSRVVPVDDEDLSRGRLQCRAMIRKVAECIATGAWPGPGAGDLRPMPLPVAEREAIDKRLGYLQQEQT